MRLREEQSLDLDINLSFEKSRRAGWRPLRLGRAFGTQSGEYETEPSTPTYAPLGAALNLFPFEMMVW